MPSDATCGLPCLHPACVSSRAHHRTHYSAHGHMQRRAYMRAFATCARLPMSEATCATSHTHTAPLSHALGLTHLCAHAHAHAHSQTDRFTHTDGISHERHTQTHTCTHMHTRTHTQLPTYTYTHDTQKNMSAHTHVHKRLCACVTHTCTHMQHTYLHTSCLHKHIHT